LIETDRSMGSKTNFEGFEVVTFIKATRRRQLLRVIERPVVCIAGVAEIINVNRDGEAQRWEYRVSIS
jgi:hypothetical protein